MQSHVPDSSSSVVGRVSSRGAAHPRLAAELAGLRIREDGTPDPASWERFTEYVDGLEHRLDRKAGHPRDRSAFENLFRISPIPMMEQDWTEFELWMADAKAAGITDLASYIGDDIEVVRALVPKVKIAAANPAAVRAVGLPLDALLGPIDPAIVNEGALPGWLAQMEAVFEGRAVAQASYKARTALGRPYDAESTMAAPVVDGRPDFSRAMFSLIDVTEHRDEERRLADEIEAKTAFLASVSHEIRTPLTGILGYAMLLDEGATSSEEERHQLIGDIAAQARELSDIVEDLLVASRAELGQLDVQVVPVAIRAQIELTLASGGTYAQNVSTRFDSTDAFAVGDPGRLRQILRNLLTNAERYGGPHVEISVRQTEHLVIVEVSDDGEGLTGGMSSRVFEPFQRAHETPGNPASIGIGLAISRQLAELMGGGLDYRFEGGRSIFRLSVPSLQR